MARSHKIPVFWCFLQNWRTSIWIPLRGDPGGRFVCWAFCLAGDSSSSLLCAGYTWPKPSHSSLPDMARCFSSALKRCSQGAAELWARSLLLRGGTNALKDHMPETEQTRSNKITAVYHSLSCLFSKWRQVWKVQRRLGRLQSAPQGATPQRAKRCKMMIDDVRIKLCLIVFIVLIFFYWGCSQ